MGLFGVLKGRIFDYRASQRGKWTERAALGILAQPLTLSPRAITW